MQQNMTHLRPMTVHTDTGPVVVLAQDRVSAQNIVKAARGLPNSFDARLVWKVTG
jgi:hypothetical protein